MKHCVAILCYNHLSVPFDCKNMLKPIGEIEPTQTQAADTDNCRTEEPERRENSTNCCAPERFRQRKIPFTLLEKKMCTKRQSCHCKAPMESYTEASSTITVQ